MNIFLAKAEWARHIMMPDKSFLLVLNYSVDQILFNFYWFDRRFDKFIKRYNWVSSARETDALEFIDWCPPQDEQNDDSLLACCRSLYQFSKWWGETEITEPYIKSVRWLIPWEEQCYCIVKEQVFNMMNGPRWNFATGTGQNKYS